jgi:hypothetical protein
VANRRTHVVSQPFPAESQLYTDAMNAVRYSDSFAARCRTGIDPPSAFIAIFGHHRGWVNSLLLVRNRLAACCGLEVPQAGDIRNPQRFAEYAVGDTLGPCPIFAPDECELVAGRNNRHLDFRVSFLRPGEGRTGIWLSPRSASHTICLARHTCC